MPLSCFHASSNAPAHIFQISNIPLAFEFQMFWHFFASNAFPGHSLVIISRLLWIYSPNCHSKLQALTCPFEALLLPFRNMTSCFIPIETSNLLRFEQYHQNLQPTKCPFKICISIPLRNTYFKHIHKILMRPSNHRNIYCIWLQSRQSQRFSDSLTTLNHFTAWCSYKTMIIFNHAYYQY